MPVGRRKRPTRVLHAFSFQAQDAASTRAGATRPSPTAPQCKGVESAGDPGSDYELWSPYDGRQSGGKCLLGHQVRYTRRRRASQCYNGEVYERVEFRKNCQCAEEDYECDFGYER